MVAHEDPDDEYPEGGLWLRDLERHTTDELRAWCLEFGLDASGNRAEVVARLRAFIEVEFPDIELDMLPDGEVVELGADELRGLLERYGFEVEGTRDQLVSWLLWFFDDARCDMGPIDTYTREELKATGAEELRNLCGMWNVSRDGEESSLVERILGAQELMKGGGGWPPRSATGHRMEPPPDVVIREE